MFIFGKIKMYIIATLALALPIIYVFGQIKGRAKEKNKVLTDELQAEQKASAFYKNHIVFDGHQVHQSELYSSLLPVL